MKYIIPNLVIIGSFLLLVACGSSPAIPTTQPNTAVPPTRTVPPATETPSPEELGRLIFENGGAHELYRPSYNCTECHSLDGREGDGLFVGPSMLGVSKRAAERVPDLSAEEYIRQSITQPNNFVVEGYSNRMSNVPAKLLSEEEVNDLVAFLLTQ